MPTKKRNDIVTAKSPLESKKIICKRINHIGGIENDFSNSEFKVTINNYKYDKCYYYYYYYYYYYL